MTPGTYDPELASEIREAIKEALYRSPGMGQEPEPIWDLYKPEGVAVVITAALTPLIERMLPFVSPQPVAAFGAIGPVVLADAVKYAAREVVRIAGTENESINAALDDLRFALDAYDLKVEAVATGIIEGHRPVITDRELHLGIGQEVVRIIRAWPTRGGFGASFPVMMGRGEGNWSVTIAPIHRAGTEATS